MHFNSTSSLLMKAYLSITPREAYSFFFILLPIIAFLMYLAALHLASKSPDLKFFTTSSALTFDTNHQSINNKVTFPLSISTTLSISKRTIVSSSPLTEQRWLLGSLMVVVVMVMVVVLGMYYLCFLTLALLILILILHSSLLLLLSFSFPLLSFVLLFVWFCARERSD